MNQYYYTINNNSATGRFWLISTAYLLTDCVQSDIRAFGITGEWKAMMALNAEVWVAAVTEGGRRFMAAWRK